MLSPRLLCSVLTLKVCKRSMATRRRSSPVPAKRKRALESQCINDQTIAPHTMYVQVLQSGCKGYGRSLIVGTDTNRMYLFNCPELNNKLSSERKSAILRTDAVFFTHGSWSNVAGLGPLCMFLKGGGYAGLAAYGPGGLHRLVESIRGYAEADEGGLQVVNVIDRDYQHHQTYEDEAIHITMIPFGSTDPDEQVSVAFAYLCAPKNRAGRLSVERCVELGIPIGPLLRDLKLGKSVTLPSGRIVEPSEVVTDAVSTKPFLVVECPNEDFIPDLAKKVKTDSELSLIVHLSPPSVCRDPAYLKFSRQLSSPPTTRHLLLNEDCPLVPHCLGLFRAQVKLNLVEPHMHPMLPVYQDPIPSKPVDMSALNARENSAATPKETADAINFIPAVPFLKVQLRPTFEFQDDACFEFSKEDALKEIEASQELIDVQSGLKKKDEALAKLAEPEIERVVYPSVVFLGTSSAGPTKLRNVAAILVRTSEDKSLLLDCGEGTVCQLFTFYGPSDVQQQLINIQLICISHLHADHQLGVFELILARQRAFRTLGRDYEPLAIVAAAPLFEELQHFATLVGIEQPVLYNLIETVPTKWTNKEHALRLQNFASRVNLAHIGIVPVKHAKMPCGFCLETAAEGKRIVYSGDTMPCPELVDFGRDCDLLIHEATFCDGREADAASKRHSTVSQAVRIGMQMRARHVILTHFSSRYRIPLLPADLPPNVGIAFDMMRLDFGDLPKMGLIRDAIVRVFYAYYAEAARVEELRQLRQTGGAQVDIGPAGDQDAEESGTAKVVKGRLDAVTG